MDSELTHVLLYKAKSSISAVTVDNTSMKLFAGGSGGLSIFGTLAYREITELKVTRRRDQKAIMSVGFDNFGNLWTTNIDNLLVVTSNFGRGIEIFRFKGPSHPFICIV